MKQVFTTLAILLCFSAAFAGENVRVQTFQTHSRLYFPLDPTVETQLKSNAKGFELLFKGISLSDLGAPLGEEEAWQKQFSQTSDPRLSGLRFSEGSEGVKVIGLWKFPQGKVALVNPQMESFDFRQNGYVVDFWLKAGSMTVAQYQVKKAETARLEKMRMIEKQKKARAERQIASEKKKAEIEDTGRFCRESLNESRDVFLRFYPVHDKIDFKNWFPVNTPDEELPYEAPSADSKSKEAQYVRLALDLYHDGKLALTLKTLEFFDTEFPTSKDRLRMKFLRVNAMIKLGMKTEARELIQALIPDAKSDPVALHLSMYMAYQQLQNGDTLAATETFLWLISHFPDHKNAWLFHLGAAECLYTLNQTDRALKEYQWVAEKGPSPEARASAALRASDLYMLRFNYEQALAGYYQAIYYFPEQSKKFAPAFINRAEALYGLGQYDRAKEAFEKFLKDFPGNPFGWRATYRLGEIQGRKHGAADVASSREWFYQTINSYPFTPGATLARLRLLPCGDHGGFDAKTSAHFYETEIAGFDPKTEIDMVPFPALLTLTRVRTMISFGEEPAAVDIAATELAKPGHVEMHEILKSTLGSVFRKSILNLLAADQKYEALAFYKEKAPYLPKVGQSPEETDFLLKLSQAASDLGMGTLAKELADTYAKANSSRNVASQAGNDDLEVQLQQSEQHFSQAEALWVSSGVKEEQAIRSHLEKVREESPFSYQREVILGLLDQRTKKSPTALAHAVRAEMLRPELPASSTPTKTLPKTLDDQRVNAWIADLQADAGDGKVALEMYKNLEKYARFEASSKLPVISDETASTLGVPPVPSLEHLILAQGAILEKLGHWGEAAATYARAVDEKVGGYEALYEYARALQKSGGQENISKARSVLEKLVNEGTPVAAASEDFWKKLAREALADMTMEGKK